MVERAAGPGVTPAPAATSRWRRGVHAWERWAPAWHGLFYAVLGLASVLAVSDPGSPWSERAAAAVLGVLLGAWYWLWVPRRGIWTLPMAQVLTYLAGAAGIWVGLVALHEAYFLLAFSAYQQVGSFLPSPRSAIVGVVGLTGLLSAMQLSHVGPPSGMVLLIALLSTGSAIMLGLFVEAIMRQSQDRHRLIGELEATRAELAAAEREAGTLGERQRLAREIHDTLAQGVISVVTLLEATEAELDPGQAVARRHLDHALRTARDTLDEARRFVWALQPDALERGSLAEALRRLADTLADETGMTTRFLVSGPSQPLPVPAEIALLRAAQEGTANIRRHAEAHEAVLTLSYLEDRVILDVRDDGRGFDPAVADDGRNEVGGGLGLRGLEARLVLLGGGLEVESTPGEGTVLVAQVPVGGAPSAPAGGPRREPAGAGACRRRPPGRACGRPGDARQPARLRGGR